MDKKEEIRQEYYYTDIEPTLIFSIDDPSTPSQVSGLFRELNKFFADEKAHTGSDGASRVM